MKLSICPCSLDLAHLPPPIFPCLVVRAHVPLPIRLANFSRLFAPFTVAHFRLLIRPCSLVRAHLAAAHLPLQFALPICPCTSPFVHWPLLIYLRPFALAHPSLPICPCPFVLSHLPLPLSPRQLVRGRAPLPSAVIHMPLSICLCPSTLAYSPLPICAHLPLPIRSYPSALVHLFVPLCHDTFALAYFPVSIRPCQFAIAHLTSPCALVHLPFPISFSRESKYEIRVLRVVACVRKFLYTVTQKMRVYKLKLAKMTNKNGQNQTWYHRTAVRPNGLRSKKNGKNR